MQTGEQKVLVIGLDGATFDIIDPLIREGRLPNLENLLQEGTRASLKSTLMPNSFPAWSSCVTGVNPGKHGIFWSLIRKNGHAYPLQLMDSKDVKARTVWDILGSEGYRVGVFNVPISYPALPVNGFLVCGALTPAGANEYTYPKSLKKEILSVVPDYKCEIDFAQMDLGRLSGQLLTSIENREKLLLHLLEKKPWDLFFAVFTESDLAQHKFWACIDEAHPDYRRFRNRFGSFVHKIYERLDQAVGVLMDTVPQHTTVFIVSDHGFGPFYQAFSLQKWLVDNDFLVVREPGFKKSAKKILALTGATKSARKLRERVVYLKRRLKGEADVRALRERDVQFSRRSVQEIAWEKTRAYFTADYGIRVNLRGREPDGIVSPGSEEKRVKAVIMEKLESLQYSNGAPVFEAILAKEEAFSGPFVSNAPDLIVPINHAGAPSLPEKWPYTLTHPTLKGNHTPYGILIGRGPEVKKGYRLQHAEITDVTPTILYLFNKVPFKDMDGHVLYEMFETRPQRFAEPIRGIAGEEGWSESSSSPPTHDSDVEQRLRDLGYID